MPFDIEVAHDAITKGLPHEAKRLHLSKVNLDYYRGDYDRWRYRIDDDPDSRCNRSSLFMKKVIDCLTSYKYRNNPDRTIPENQEATDWLQKQYANNSMYAKFQAADRLTLIGAGGAVAFQVAGVDDGVKIHVWSEDSFAIFRNPDDPLAVSAVITMDTEDDNDRWTLYTADHIRKYLRETDSIEKFVLVEEEGNPYKVLPFAFAHFESPVLDFWTGSPGNVLREVQDYIIFRMTSLADAMAYPRQKLRNYRVSMVGLCWHALTRLQVYPRKYGLLSILSPLIGLSRWETPSGRTISFTTWCRRPRYQGPVSVT